MKTDSHGNKVTDFSDKEIFKILLLMMIVMKNSCQVNVFLREQI